MQHFKGLRLVTFLYNHNPFYLISAGLVLYGIRSSFLHDGETTVNPWILAAAIAAYTALLAVTGYLIVRFGRVWDDARSIFMVLLLLFFALSVSFDSLCIESPSTAVMMLTAGFLFAALVTELLLWSLEIKLPKQFKVPYYLMLAASFFYPLAMSAQQLYFSNFDARWLLLGFSFLSAGAILSLVPAIRRGAKHVSRNGTPWVWPMFPYSAFVLLIVGLCGRSALLAMAFDPTSGPGSVFGSYFLVPIFLAVVFVIFEIGIVEKSKIAQGFALWASPLAILLALNWEADYGQIQFTDHIASVLGSPVWLTLIAIVGVYSFAAMRKVSCADIFLHVSLIAAIVCCPSGEIVTSVSQLAVWPCLMLAGLQLVSAEKRQRSARWMAAAFWLSFVVGQAGVWLEHPEFALAIAVHWLLLSAILIGFVFKDRFALQLRIVGAVCLPIFAMVFWLIAIFGDMGLEKWTVVYTALLGVVGFGVFRWLKDRLYFCASALSVAIALLSAAASLRPEIGQSHRQAVLLTAIGFACFAIGVLVSCLKAGMARRIQKSFNRMIVDTQYSFRLVDEQERLDTD